MVSINPSQRNYVMSKAAVRFGLRLDDADVHLLAQYDVIALKRANGSFAPFARTKAKPRRATALARILCSPTAAEVVDHVNGDPWDNRRSNLRVCTQAENVRNARISNGHSVGFKGVYRNGSRFAARISANGAPLNLGTFDTPEEASRAYDNAAREIFGEYCAVNLPVSGERSATLDGGRAHG